MWDNIKPPNTFVTGIPGEGREGMRKGKKGLEEILAKNFQNLI